MYWKKDLGLLSDHQLNFSEEDCSGRTTSFNCSHSTSGPPSSEIRASPDPSDPLSRHGPTGAPQLQRIPRKLLG